MASIEQLKEIRQEYQDTVNDLDAQPKETNNGLSIREVPNAGRFGTQSSTDITSLKAANDERESARVQARAAKVGEAQLSAVRGQGALIEQQLDMQRDQANSMKALHQTMQQMLALMVAEQKKLSPKQQAFAGNNAMNDEAYTGEAKDGVMDKLGGLMGGLMDWGRNRRDRNRDRRNPRDTRNQNNRNNNQRPNRSRTSRLWDSLTRRASGARHAAGNAWSATPRKGKFAVISGLVLGAGAGAWSMFGGGGDDDPTAADVADVQNQTRHFGIPPDAHYGQQAANGLWQGQAPSEGSWAGDSVVRNNPMYTTPSYAGLGSISAAEESRGLRSTVSTGQGDHGGVSYGVHQLSSNAGSMDEFLRSPEGKVYADAFKGTRSGGAAFSARFRELSEGQQGEQFAADQKAYVSRTHYEPQVQRVSQATGVDFGSKGRGVQEMLYSTGVQYGPSTNVIVNALKGKDVQGMTDADIIRAVQSYKQQSVDKYFESSSPAVRRSVAQRAQREGTQLLALNARDVEAAQHNEDPMKAGAIGNVAITNARGAQGLMQGPRAHAQSVTGSQVSLLTNHSSVAAHGAQEGRPMPFSTNTDEGSMDMGKRQGLIMTGMLAVILNHTRVNMDGLHPKFKQAFYAMIGDWKQNHGGTVCCVESAFRTRAEQEALWVKYGKNTKRVARPGTSRHESGFAIDIDRKSAGALESKGLLAKYGFHRPLSNEPWHIEMTAAARSAPTITEPDGVQVAREAGAAATQAADAEQQVASADTMGGVDVTSTSMPIVPPLIGRGPSAPTTAPTTSAPTPPKPATPATDAEVKVSDGKHPPKAANAAGRGVLRAGGSKAIPIVGTAITAAEAVSIVTDDTMTKDEKVAAGTELAGGTAGAIVGGKAGAAAGAAIGSAFFGVGAVPGALIGGAIGSVGGYIAGSWGAKKAHDAIAGEPSPESGVVESVTPSKPPSASEVASIMNSAVNEGSETTAVTSSIKPVTSTTSSLMPDAGTSATPDVASGGVTDMIASLTTMGVPEEWRSTLAAEMEEAKRVMANPQVASVPVPSVVQPESPASSSYYNASDIALHRPSHASPDTSPVVSATPAATRPMDVSTRSHAEPVEREAHNPVRSVIALNVKEQNTMMPDRFKPEGERIPARGVSSSNSSRQTLDDCPVSITDGGIVLLQTGFI